MREDDCRSLLCLQQNFAKMLKPRVQAVVTASCYKNSLSLLPARVVANSIKRIFCTSGWFVRMENNNCTPSANNNNFWAEAECC